MWITGELMQSHSHTVCSCATGTAAAAAAAQFVLGGTHHTKQSLLNIFMLQHIA